MMCALAAASCAPAIDFRPHDDRYEVCGRRAGPVPVRSGGVTLVGTVYKIDDATPVDGPVRLVMIDLQGAPRKLFFGSLLTSPSPSEHRKSVYRAIARSRPGECARIHGTVLHDGSVVVEEFQNLDPSRNIHR